MEPEKSNVSKKGVPTAAEDRRRHTQRTVAPRVPKKKRESGAGGRVSAENRTAGKPASKSADEKHPTRLKNKPSRASVHQLLGVGEIPDVNVLATGITQGSLPPRQTSSEEKEAAEIAPVVRSPPVKTAQATTALMAPKSNKQTPASSSGKPSSPFSPIRTKAQQAVLGLRNLARSPEVGSGAGSSPMWSRKTMWNAAVISLPFATAFLFIGLLALFDHYVRPRETHPHVCNTDDCHTHAYVIGDGLAPDVDPCDDFGAFVCSAWKREIEDVKTNGTTEEISLAWINDNAEILREGAMHLPAGEKAVAMFRSCVQGSEKDEEKKIKLLRKFVADRGLSWPERTSSNVSVVEVLVDLAVNWLLPLWFDVKLLPADGTRPRVILISPSLLSHLWHRIHHMIAGHGVPAYFAYWDFFFDKIALKKNLLEYKNQVEREFVIEHAIIDPLTEIWPTNLEPHVFPLKMMPDYSRWMRALQRAFNASDLIHPEDLLYVTNKRFLNTINEILEDYDNAQLLSHLAWWLTQVVGISTINSFFDFLIGHRAKSSRLLPLLCAAQVEASYSLLMAANDATSRFTKHERDSLDSFLTNISETTIDKINSLGWLDAKSKVSISAKIRRTSRTLWPIENIKAVYERFPRNATTFLDFWIETRKEIRNLLGTTSYDFVATSPSALIGLLAEYNYLTNSIFIQLSCLRPPFYYRKGTKAMLYAGIGFLYASQVVRAFDPDGICIGATGSFGNGSLLHESEKAYADKAHCGSSSATRVCPPENRENSIFPLLPALEVTYSAFKALAGEKDLPLENLERYTPEQVFFITVCYSRCYVNFSHDVKEGCNQLLMHFPPFAEAFRCPRGSRMNPRVKCQFF